MEIAALPIRRAGWRWVSFFALSWFGVWFAQLTPVQLLLPLQLEEFLDTTDWVQNVLGFGVISGIAGAFALIAYPLAGALTDRTTSRFGRRRPWIAAGTAGFAAALLALVTTLGLGTFGGYALMAAILVVLTLPFLLLIPEAVLPRGVVS